MVLSSPSGINVADRKHNSFVLICQYDFKETYLGFVMHVFALTFALFIKAGYILWTRYRLFIIYCHVGIGELFLAVGLQRSLKLGITVYIT